MSNRSSLDERAIAPAEASRRGAHRARPRAIPSGLPVVAAVAVILLVVGGSYAVLTAGRSPDSSQQIAGAEDDGPSATGAPSTGSTPSGASATPSASRASHSATPSSSASSSSAASGAIDKTATVSVLNSVPVQGLAARVKTNLADDGWNVVSTGNSQQRGLSVTKVYYRKASLQATAQKLAKDLQFGQADLNPAVSGSSEIIVVLGRDAQ